MTDNTLQQQLGGTVVPENWNQYLTALINDFVGRNGAGAPEKGKKNGTAVIPWGEIHGDKLYLNGALFDPDNIGGNTGGNGVVSGATRSGSAMPDFLRANGAGTSLNILASATPLNFNVGSVGVSVSSDLSLGSLNTAPASDNTAQVNDSSLSADKYAGENGATITLDNVGNEITDRAGQIIALKHGTSEIMFARVSEADGGANTATLDNVFRGFFFDSAGVPIVREGLNNNDTLTLYNLAWVFLQSDGTTLDVTYRTPVWSFAEPSSPVIDDYWFDMNNQIWMRYDGSLFEQIERLHIGWVVIDGTNCIASRCVDFSKNFEQHISIETGNFTDTTVSSKGESDSVHVYGSLISFGNSSAIWDITASLETGLVESASQFLYLYVTQNGQTVLSDIHPYNRESDLRGYYHPYHSWRYVGVAYNDSGNDFSSVNSHNSNDGREDIYKSSGEFLSIPNKHIKAIVQAGGGGGGGTSGAGTNGGSSSFGSLVSATGGTKGNNGGGKGSGGNGSGGDISIGGGDGFGDGNGGGTFFAGITSAGHGNYYGGGGGGADSTRGGGGGGGTGIMNFKQLIGRIYLTVGGGGGGGTAGGGVGRQGCIFLGYR